MATLSAYRMLHRIAADERPDVIYCSGHNGILCPIIARRLAIPCFTRMYGIMMMGLFDGSRCGFSTLRSARRDGVHQAG